MGTSLQYATNSGGKRFAKPQTNRFRSPLDKAKGYEVIWQQVAPIFDAARSIGNIEFVYFIGEVDEGPLKIGVSKDPIGRLRSMQTGNPRRLRVEHVLVGDGWVEKLLHEMWDPHAIYSARQAGKPQASPGTEWFKAEIRIELEPILRTAAELQVAWLSDPDAELVIQESARIIREAHVAHDHVAHKHHSYTRGSRV